MHHHTNFLEIDPEHERRYKPDVEAQNIHRFFESVRFQIAAITQGLGYTDVRQLNREDLVAVTPEAAKVTGLPYEPKYLVINPVLELKAG